LQLVCSQVRAKQGVSKQETLCFLTNNLNTEYVAEISLSNYLNMWQNYNIFKNWEIKLSKKKGGSK
jgi:hypothetical protein